MTTVALLTVTSVSDAAPLMPGQPDAFEEPADGGETGKNPNQLTAYIHEFSRFFYLKTYIAFNVYI